MKKTTRDNIRLFFSNKLGVIGTLIIAAFIIVTLFAPLISPYDAYERTGPPFAKPSRAHVLGTNDIGQDILSELLYGTRISLVIGLLSAAVALTIGTAIGLAAGYMGGRTDAVLMRVVDISLVLPMLPMMMLLAAFLGPNIWNMIFVIGILSWSRPARVIRSHVLTLRNKGYIEAVKVIGGKPTYIIVKHILPPTLSIIISQLIIVTSRSILMEASLSFLGLGDASQKSWGMMLYYAQNRSAFLTNAWVWWILPPGLLITLMVVSLAYTGNSLERIVNPRLRG